MKINILFLLACLTTLNSCSKDPEDSAQIEKEALDENAISDEVAALKDGDEASIRLSEKTDVVADLKKGDSIEPVPFEFKLATSHSEENLKAYALYSLQSDKLYLEWKSKVEPVFSLLATTVGKTSIFEKKAIEAYEQKRRALNQRYSRAVVEVESNKLKEILKIQTKKMMKLTNQKFDEQLQNVKHAETSQKLVDLNKRIDILSDKLNGLGSNSSNQKLKEATALSLDRGSIRGVDPKVDKLLAKLDDAYEIYQKKRSNLYSKHKSLMSHFSPIECRAVYHQDKVNVQYVEIYNRSDKEVQLSDLVVTLEMKKLFKSFDFTKGGISQWSIDGRRPKGDGMLAPKTSYFYKCIKNRNSSVSFIKNRYSTKFYSHSYIVDKAFRDIKAVLQFDKPCDLEWACGVSDKLYMSQDSKYGQLAKILKRDKNLKSLELGLLNAVIEESQPKVSTSVNNSKTVEVELKKREARRIKLIEINRELMELRRLHLNDIRSLKQRVGANGSDYSEGMRKIRSKYKTRSDKLQKEKWLLSSGDYNSSRANINKSIDEVNRAKSSFSKQFSKLNSEREKLLNPESVDHLVHLDAVVTVNGETYFKIKNIGKLKIKGVAFQLLQSDKLQAVEKLVKYDSSNYRASSYNPSHLNSIKVFPLAPGDSFYIKQATYNSSDARYIMHSIKSETEFLARAKGKLAISEEDGTFRFQQIYAK